METLVHWRGVWYHPTYLFWRDAMIELTEQQRQEVGEATHPVRVVDPATKREFFLIRAEVFSSLQSLLGDIDPRDAYPAVDRALAPGWDDPKMADYDNYEQKKR
jgi:hypothetical protein